MDLTQCARFFRILPSPQSGALRRPYCALYFEIYVVRSVQPGWSGLLVTSQVALAGQIQVTHIYTDGGHNSYSRLCRLDWKSSELAIKPTKFELKGARTHIWNRAIFKQRKNQRLSLGQVSEAEKNNRKFQLEKNLKIFELWLYSIGIVILLHFCDPM